MQNVYYIDSNFIKENSSQYILSIRYSTDGLSFCVHNHNHQLLVFFFQPYQLDSQDAVIAKVKKIMVEDELLNLKYKKVYILPCQKEKILLPAHVFNKNTLGDMYRICLQPQKNDILLYRKIKAIESYLVEVLPRSFVNFLSSVMLRCVSSIMLMLLSFKLSKAFNSIPIIYLSTYTIGISIYY